MIINYRLVSIFSMPQGLGQFLIYLNTKIYAYVFFLLFQEWWFNEECFRWRKICGEFKISGFFQNSGISKFRNSFREFSLFVTDFWFTDSSVHRFDFNLETSVKVALKRWYQLSNFNCYLTLMTFEIRLLNVMINPRSR